MKRKIKRSTSANVDAVFHKEICMLQIRFHKSRSAILKDIIELTIAEIKCGRVKGILTEYQDHCPEKWETVYYTLDEEEIEIYSSARQKYKISISKLAFIGFLLFWRLLIQKYSETLFTNNQKIELSLINYEQYKTILNNFVKYFQKRLMIQLKE